MGARVKVEREGRTREKRETRHPCLRGLMRAMEGTKERSEANGAFDGHRSLRRLEVRASSLLVLEGVAFALLGSLGDVSLSHRDSYVTI